MITAEFLGVDHKQAFKVHGHAGFSCEGNDIVCAAVSSAVQLTVNGITEVLKVKAQVEVTENIISLKLPSNPPKAAISFVDALFLHLSILAEDYAEHIKVITEV